MQGVNPIKRPADAFAGQTHIETFTLYGALDYSLDTAKELLRLARGIDNPFRAKPYYTKKLGEFVGQIESTLDQHHAMRTVLAASLKDKHSHLHMLGPDILFQIIRCMQQPEILRWDVVTMTFV